LLPDWHYSTRAEAHVRAPAAEALAAVGEVTLSELPLTGALLLARSLPSLLTRRLRPPSRKGPLFELLTTTPGFLRLQAPPGMLVGGYVGRPWQLAGGSPAGVKSVEQFKGFEQAGYAKVLMHFEAMAEGEGSRIVTETRIHLTDENARRAFGRYWRIVRIGSDLIRKDWLRAAGRRAEKNK
jgi:hypothetical protein